MTLYVTTQRLKKFQLSAATPSEKGKNWQHRTPDVDATNGRAKFKIMGTLVKTFFK